MATIPQGARDFLATGPLAHVVTINPDGSPHVSLAWAGVDGDGLIWSSSRFSTSSTTSAVTHG